jgi:RHS repeat-associated protein
MPGRACVVNSTMRIAGYGLNRVEIANGLPALSNSPGNTKPYKGTLNRFLFQGREWDADMQFYDFRTRAYSPILGRFLQQDPLGYHDSMCLYQFVNNNPVCFIAPFGTIKKEKRVAFGDANMRWFRRGSPLGSMETCDGSEEGSLWGANNKTGNFVAPLVNRKPQRRESLGLLHILLAPKA